MNPEPRSGFKVPFYNLSIDVIDRPQLFDLLRQSPVERGKLIINFLNAHCFNVAQRDAEYLQALRDSTLLLNDGIGIDIAGRLLGIRFPENMNGTDLIPELVGFFAQRGQPVFFYGARQHVITEAVSRFRRRFPDLRVAGFCDGYVDDPLAVAQQINESGAEVVVVGMGVPRQELWVARHADDCRSASIFICGGAIFDFVSGTVVRAPRLIRMLKLEWLFRLLQEPRRLFSRYVIGNFRFLWHILRNRP
jgi:N-acetylglucosaminyldiphosphoundecaprenol N-acetyl-beta-D-mannosaminyltransferase